MGARNLPKISMTSPATGCCAEFDPAPWDEQEFTFENKLFIKTKTVNFCHIPLNMGAVFKNTCEKIRAADACDGEFAVLSDERSFWSAAHYFLVSKEVPGVEMIRLSGTFLTKVYEGPYKQVPKWIEAMKGYVRAKGQAAKQFYCFYTTCPKCAKQYGKNYVVLFAEV
jgi:hypothetical protein